MEWINKIIDSDNMSLLFAFSDGKRAKYVTDSLCRSIWGKGKLSHLDGLVTNVTTVVRYVIIGTDASMDKLLEIINFVGELGERMNEDFSMGVSGPTGLNQGIPHGGPGKGVLPKPLFDPKAKAVPPKEEKDEDTEKNKKAVSNSLKLRVIKEGAKPHGSHLAHCKNCGKGWTYTYYMDQLTDDVYKYLKAKGYADNDSVCPDCIKACKEYLEKQDPVVSEKINKALDVLERGGMKAERTDEAMPEWFCRNPWTVDDVDHYLFHELGFEGGEVDDLIALNLDLINSMLEQGKSPKEVADALDYSTVQNPQE